MIPQKIKDISLFVVKYFTIGGLIVGGGLAVLLGTQAFQTMTPSTPTATGTTLSVNNSTGTYLAMRGRAPCSSGTAMIYEDKCLDVFTWTAANRAACLAKKGGGWISVNPEHLNAVNSNTNLVWSYYGTTANARYGFKFFVTVAGANAASNPMYYSSFQNLGGSLSSYTNSIGSPGFQYPTQILTASPIIDNSYVTVDNTGVSFICAYYRDLGN